jgi:hypothetical protein
MVRDELMMFVAAGGKSHDVLRATAAIGNFVLDSLPIKQLLELILLLTNE